MASDLERIAQGLIDYLDANPRMAAELGAAAAQCQQLAAEVAELAVILPEAATAAEYLQQAANDCSEAAQLSARATMIGRNWAAEAVGSAGGGAVVAPAGRDAAAGNSPKPMGRPDVETGQEEQVQQMQLDLALDLPVQDPVSAEEADEERVDLSSKDPDHVPVLSAPPAGATVRVDEKFTYSTDAASRVTNAHAKLDLVDLAHPRDEAAQRRLAGKLPGDHAGHIFARIFQGPIGTMNLTPMAGTTVNLSAYKTMENHWRRIINDGGTVDVFVTFTYTGDSRRPDTIWVEYEHGDELVARRISNDPIKPQGGTS